MKNIFKVFSLMFILTLTVSCESNSADDLGYSAQEESGWVQFMDTNPEVFGFFQGATGTIDLEIKLQVPTTSSDLTIFYALESVSGADPNAIFSNNGAIVAPEGLTSYMGPDNSTGFEYEYLSMLTVDLQDLNGATLTEPMIFDIVLTGTSSPLITAGLEGETLPVSQRVIINPSIDTFVGTYTVTEAFTAGTNAGFGLVDFFNESYQVELSLMDNDATASKMMVSNSSGFDTYFIEDSELTFGGDGTLFFDDGNNPGNPVIALFAFLTVESSSYDYSNMELMAAGALGNFGPYAVTLTKQ
tara:strand:- start:2410 stop:3312 length:903 start_codon:yes stop_codon:yes gene_type:complete